MVLTVMSNVSGHCSIGPTAVLLQSKVRVRAAISPVPKMTFCGKVGGAAGSSFFSWDSSGDFSWNFTVTNGSLAHTGFQLRRSACVHLMHQASQSQLICFIGGMG